MRTFKLVRVIVVIALLASLTISLCAHSQINLTSSVIASANATATADNEAAPVLVPDSLKNTSTYFTIRQDLRRCASPLCGGYFVKRVNQPQTRCANGRFATQCYVAEIEWNGPTVDPKRALLRGEIRPKNFPAFGNLGIFQVSEAWEAASDKAPSGTFFRAKDRGVRCITFPCLTHHEATLNSTLSREVAGVDLKDTGVSDELISQATQAMTAAEGILTAGANVIVTGPGGRARELKATQFYLPAKKDVTSNKKCMRTGCSGQICADEQMMTTCVWKAEYACYQKATCERQTDGNCGFTKTPELTACLNRL
jgi:hypothetical protein